jgi:hypothetical protein
VIDEVTQKLVEVQQQLAPYIITLSGEERKSLMKTSDKTISFVTKSNDYSKSNPEFIPNFMEVDQFNANFDNYTALQPLMKFAEQICSSINDTTLMNGSEALSASLQYYNFVKQADKNSIKNAKEIYADLSVRFTGRKTKKQDSLKVKDDGSQKDDTAALKVA